MLRMITRLQPAQTRASLRASCEDYQRQLLVERAANAALTKQLAALTAEPDSRPPLSAPIHALAAWYAREPVTAVLGLPSRDSVRAALEEWQAGLTTPEPALDFPGNEEF